METKRLNPSSKVIRNVALTIFLATFGLLFVALIVLSVLGAFPNNEWWSGFGQTRLWDWLQLITVPFTVVFVGIVIIAFLYTTSVERNARQAREAETEVSKIANFIKTANPANIQEVAASQLIISSRYYESVLQQSERSFRWALVWASIGTLIIVLSIFFFIVKEPTGISAYGSLIGGIVVEAIGGLNFYLYARATNQLANFQAPLDRIGRFLIANSICESLEGSIKTSTRARLVETIANVPTMDFKKENFEAEATTKMSNPDKLGLDNLSRKEHLSRQQQPNEEG